MHTITPIDLPGAEHYRFARRANDARPRVVLQRHLVGPLWTEVDSRPLTATTPPDEAEAEMLEDWFSLEIARAKN